MGCRVSRGGFAVALFFEEGRSGATRMLGIREQKAIRRS